MVFKEFIEENDKLDLLLGLEKSDLLRVAEMLVLGIVALLVILLVIRPLISRAFEMSSTVGASDQAASERLLTDQGLDTPALAGPDGALVPSGINDDDEQLEELIDIDRVEGRLKASALKKITDIVEKHPEEATSIIRGWMYQET